MTTTNRLLRGLCGESTKIGSAEKGGAKGFSDTGYSHRRSRTISTTPPTFGLAWGPVQTKKAPVNNPTPQIRDVSPCKSTVTFSPSAAYPFLPAPKINYTAVFTFEVIRRDTVKVTLEGSHNLFPDYEGYVDGPTNYEWQSPFDAPGIWNLGILWKSFRGDDRIIDAATP